MISLVRKGIQDNVSEAIMVETDVHIQGVPVPCTVPMISLHHPDWLSPFFHMVVIITTTDSRAHWCLEPVPGYDSSPLAGSFPLNTSQPPTKPRHDFLNT